MPSTSLLRAARPKRRLSVGLVRVFRSPGATHRGLIVAGSFVTPCSIGRTGTTRRKREGDGASPVGRHGLIGLFYRADRMGRPRPQLPVVAIRPQDGWCDEPGDRRYNSRIPLPDAASHEKMWREDHLYDLVVDIAYNRGPVRPGRGSAIFLHLRAPDSGPTAGCVAVPAGRARALLARLGPQTRIEIRG